MAIKREGNAQRFKKIIASKKVRQNNNIGVLTFILILFQWVTAPCSRI